MVNRSIFKLMPVIQLVEMLKRTAWEVTDRIQEFCRSRFSAIFQSKLIEDGFHYERVAQDSQPRKKLTEPRAWKALVKGSLLHDNHKFQRVPLSTSTEKGEC